jgi:excisionase family DNA binding protein
MAEDEYLTADQVATKLQLHARTIRRLLVSGELPGKKIGGKEWRISAASLREYIENGSKKPAVEPKAE